MKIGVDIDGVVANFTKKYMEFYKNKINNNIKYEDLTHYNVWKFFDLSEEEYYSMVHTFYESEEFEDMDLIKGVIEAISELSKNNEIIFITSRPEKIRIKTEKFLSKSFKNIDFTVFFAHDWGSKEEYKKSKGDYCVENNIPFFIEDHYDYALECAKKGIKVFLLEQPWNKESEEHENIIKVKDWKEILEKINGY